MKVSIYAECTPTSGLGHVYRSIGLARELEKRGHRVTLASSSVFGSNIIASMTKSINITTAYTVFSDDHKADWILIDTIEEVKKPKGKNAKLCFLAATGSNLDKNIQFYDLVVCSGIPVRAQNDKKWLIGFDYALIWPELSRYVDVVRKKKVFLYKSIYGKMPEIRNLEELLRGSFVVEPPKSISQPMRLDHWLTASHLVIAPFGMTILESAYLGIPSICFNMNDYAQKSYDFVVRSGASYGVSINDNFVANVMNKAKSLSDEFIPKGKNQVGLYGEMSSKGKSLIDGRGCERIINKIEELT